MIYKAERIFNKEIHWIADTSENITAVMKNVFNRTQPEPVWEDKKAELNAALDLTKPRSLKYIKFKNMRLEMYLKYLSVGNTFII